MGPCPLCTPPVAIWDGMCCEYEVVWAVYTRWDISRNMAAVGEPAAGSSKSIL